jgi:ribosomal protein L40E
MSDKRSLRIFCPTHEAVFETAESPKILCEITEHALSVGFPNSEFWEFCCNCETFTPSLLDKGEKARKSCYGCGNEISKYFACSSCKIVVFESDAQTKGKSYTINAGGIEPRCPGCRTNLQNGAMALHQCREIETRIVTSRSDCPFCLEKTVAAKTQQRAEVAANTMQICSQCGADNAAASSFCGKCRHQLRGDVTVAKLGTDINKTQILGSLCPNCSTPVPPKSDFCGECGQAVKKASAPPPPPPPKKNSEDVLTYGTQTSPIADFAPNNNMRNIVFGGIGAVFAFIIIITIVSILSKPSSGSYDSNVNSGSLGNSNWTMTNTRQSNKTTTSQISISKTPNKSSSDSKIGKTGALSRDANLRETASKDSSWIGTHYKGARVTILDVTTVPNSLGGTTDWYKIEVTAYGNSMAPDKYGEYGKDPESADVGWVNSYPEVFEGNRKVRRTLIDFD